MHRRVIKSKLRGGELPVWSKNAPISKQLQNLHVSKRILPLMDESSAIRYVDISSKFFEIIPPTGQNMTSNTQRFNIPSDSETMISLSESYFVVNINFADAVPGGAGVQPQATTLCNFASHLFLDNIQTRISGLDVSDNHVDGLYAYSALTKRALQKPREDPSYATYGHSDSITGEAQAVETLGNLSGSDDAFTVLESVPLPNQTMDDCYLVPVKCITVEPIQNLNGEFYRQLLTPNSNYNGSMATSNPSFEFKVRPAEGIWETADYLPPGTQLDVQLKIANINKWFQWETGSQPTVSINSIALYLARIKPTSDSLTAVNSALNVSPFTYPINYTRCETYQVQTSANTPATMTINCLQGIVPNSIVASLVLSSTFDRSDTCSNPLSCGNLRQNLANANFNAPIVTRMSAIISGQKYPQQSQYLCNVSSDYLTSTINSYDEYVKMCLDQSAPYLSYQHWMNSFQLFCLNTTASGDCPLTTPTDDTRNGSTTLTIELGPTQYANNYTLVVVALQQAEVVIDRSRNAMRNGF